MLYVLQTLSISHCLDFVSSFYRIHSLIRMIRITFCIHEHLLQWNLYYRAVCPQEARETDWSLKNVHQILLAQCMSRGANLVITAVNNYQIMNSTNLNLSCVNSWVIIVLQKMGTNLLHFIPKWHKVSSFTARALTGTNKHRVRRVLSVLTL